MTEPQKKNLRIGVVVTALVLCAILARVAGLLQFHKVATGLLRSGIYIGLLAAWGVSVRLRIVQTQVRRYLTAVALLMVFWMAERTAKYFFVTDWNVGRHLWYGYYFPMLFIPLLAVFVSFSLGRPENFRLPKWTTILYLPTTLALLLVLTNDLHQWVFTFTSVASLREANADGYEMGVLPGGGLDDAVYGDGAGDHVPEMPHPTEQTGAVAAPGASIFLPGLWCALCHSGALAADGAGGYDRLPVRDVYGGL